MINAVYQLISPGIIDVAFKEIETGDKVIVRPEYMSICKADIRYYSGLRNRETLLQKLPMALIHECVATVISDPTGHFKKGDSVIPVPNLPVEHDSVVAENYLETSLFCSSGHDGFLRDYVDIDAERLVKVPDGLDRRIAAFFELISVSVHALTRFDKFSHSRRDSIGIWGDGNLGFITALLVRALYPDTKLYVFGTVHEKLMYFTFADGVFHVDRVPEGIRVDHAFECVGGEGSRGAIDQIISLIKPEGSVALMGVSESYVGINTRTVLDKGLRLFGSSRSGKADFEKACEIVSGHPEIAEYLQNLIAETVEVRSIDDIHKAFTSDIHRHFGKTIIKWAK